MFLFLGFHLQLGQGVLWSHRKSRRREASETLSGGVDGLVSAGCLKLIPSGRRLCWRLVGLLLHNWRLGCGAHLGKPQVSFLLLFLSFFGTGFRGLLVILGHLVAAAALCSFFLKPFISLSFLSVVFLPCFLLCHLRRPSLASRPSVCPAPFSYDFRFFTFPLLYTFDRLHVLLLCTLSHWSKKPASLSTGWAQASEGQTFLYERQSGEGKGKWQKFQKYEFQLWKISTSMYTYIYIYIYIYIHIYIHIYIDTPGFRGWLDDFAAAQI